MAVASELGFTAVPAYFMKPIDTVSDDERLLGAIERLREIAETRVVTGDGTVEIMWSITNEITDCLIRME